MKPSTKPWPLKSIHGIKERINTNPDFQRPPVWGLSQKQLLIDTILRDYDVPKLYWKKTGSKPDRYDVVDGQQRLRAIWSFFDGEFKLPKNADPIEGNEIRNLTYNELPDELRLRIDVYPLDIIILEDMDDDEVREMFLRLQNGTTLKAQEKRNAYPGLMRDFIKTLVSHSFFQKVGFANSRFAHDLSAAQLVCLELAKGPTNLKNTDLNKMYESQQSFDAKCPDAKQIFKNLNLLDNIFKQKTPELERFNITALYCAVSDLDKNYSLEMIKDDMCAWFLEFENTRRSQEELSEDVADSEWMAYKEKISHSTDSADSIKWRTEFMFRNLLGAY